MSTRANVRHHNGRSAPRGDASLAVARHPAVAVAAHIGNQEMLRLVGGGGGEPLPPLLRAFFESRLGHDLGRVRLHTDDAASRSAEALGAAAYAVGPDVVLGRGAYAPETSAGRGLLAHELAHVVQQERGGDRGLPPGGPAMEAAAARAAEVAGIGSSPVSVDGVAATGVALTPRSLAGTVDPTTMTQSELEEEVREIRSWLEDHPGSSAERDLLEAVLPELERRLRTAPADLPAVWKAFEPRFNDTFRTILHVFDERGRSRDLPAWRLYELFTDGQRRKLEEFMAPPHPIPERLFNGDEVGGATAQQRILISAHILANGTHRPGSFDQPVHARMCFHWAHLVYHYAGVTPAGGPLTQGVMGGFDHAGDMVLGTGRMEHPFPSARPGQPNNILPISRLDEVRPGDWLYVYTANRSPSGNHSVIFSHWVHDTRPDGEGGPSYRTAIVFDHSTSLQGRGRQRSLRIGAAYDAGRHIVPIVAVRRVAPEARPASTPEELFPDGGRRRAKRLSQTNARYLERQARILARREGRPYRPINVAWLMQWLREQNAFLLGLLEGRISDGQRSALEEANQRRDIEMLVRLNQRLRARAANAELLDRNMARTFGADLDERHATASLELEAAREATAADLAAIDALLRAVETAIGNAERRRRARDLRPQIRKWQRELREVWERMRTLRRGPDRTRLGKERQDIRARLDKLRREQRARGRELREVRREIRRLERERRRLGNRRRAVVSRQERSEARLPFGLTHPGRLNDQVRERITGRLSDLDPQPPWEALVELDMEPVLVIDLE